MAAAEAIEAGGAPRGASAEASSPRERRRAAHTTRILQLAMRQVEHCGLEGLTLQEIARELDYTVASLYRYFPSKDALVAELQRRVVELLDGKLAEVEGATTTWLDGLAPEAREPIAELAPLAATGLFYSGLALAAPQAFGLLAVSLGDPRRLIDEPGARAVIETAQPMFDRIARHCECAVAAGRLAPGDSNERALVLWSSLHGVAQLAKLHRLAPDRIDSERLCDALLQTLLVGWGGDAAFVDATLDAVRSAGVGQATVSADDLAHDGGGPEARPS